VLSSTKRQSLMSSEFKEIEVKISDLSSILKGTTLKVLSFESAEFF
jgi:hypothetical protein